MTILVFIYALLIGSFLNVCIYRIPEHRSIVSPGSQCGSCQTFLKPRDLVPVFSWLFSKGKCRYCGKNVSVQYPLIELFTGLMTTILYLSQGLQPLFIWTCLLLWTGIVITMIDLKYELIPDSLNVIVGVGGLAYYGYQMLQTHALSPWPLAGSLIGGGFLLLLALFNAMGGGDIKYMLGAGLYLGPALTVFSLYVAFILGGAVALGLVLTKRYKKGMHIPFGPFLVIGVITSFVYGQQILATYFIWIQR